MNYKNNLHLKYLIAILMLMIVGCKSNSLQTPTESKPVTQEPTQSDNIQPTSTIVFEEVPTSTKTETPRAATIVAVTPSPIPILSAEEAEKAIEDLLQNNGDCQFPCWWGITPGKTSIYDAKDFFKTLQEHSLISDPDKRVGVEFWRLSEDKFFIDILVDITYDQENSGLIEGFHITTQVKEIVGSGYEVVWENPLSAQYFRGYSVSKILQTYGPPQNVLIFAIQGWGEFDILLNYAEEGFVIRYSTPLEQSGDIFSGCLSKAYMDIHVWDKNLRYTWAEGITKTSGGESWEVEWLEENFLNLSDTTNLTIDDFYQVFQNPNYVECFETSVDLWPPP